MIITKAYLAAEAGVGAYFIATPTLETLALQNLTGRLMLHLVVFADVVLAEAADEDAAPVVPHAPLTLATYTVQTRARAPVRLQTLLAVADPGLAVVAHRPHQIHPSGEGSGVLDYTISRLLLALRLATVPAHR